MGYDKADPTAQAAAAPGGGVIWQDKVILNGASGLTPAVDGVSIGGTEDRAGFSGTPLRMWLSRLTAAGTSFRVGANATSGGVVNEGSTVLACAGLTPANGAPCLPDKDALAPANPDAYYSFYAYLVDQAGNEVDTGIQYDWLLDVTVPTTQNVALPPQVVAGATVRYSAPVTDVLDLWEVAFGFDFGNDLTYIPFGENVMVGDGDRWDGLLVNNATAILDLDKAVVARERASAAAAGIFAAAGGVNAPSGTVNLATTVRAITEDAAGNLSAAAANNFIPGTVDPNGAAASYTAGAGTTAIGAFDVTSPSGGVTLCNGQGSTACAAPAVKSTTITVTTLGVSGVFPNPFGADGKIFFYVHQDGDVTYYNGVTDLFYLVGSVDASSATFTDDGTVRTYSFSFALTSDMVASFSPGAINVVAIGFNGGTGTALVSQPNALIAVVNGS